MMDCYKRAMDIEVSESQEMIALTKKDQGEGFSLAKRGMLTLILFVLLLTGIAYVAIQNDQSNVAIAALSPIGVAAIDGLVTVTLRGRKQQS